MVAHRRGPSPHMTVSQISSLVEDEAAAGYDLAPSWVEVFPLLLLLLCLASPPPKRPAHGSIHAWLRWYLFPHLTTRGEPPTLCQVQRGSGRNPCRVKFPGSLFPQKSPKSHFDQILGQFFLDWC